jgi:hypothetical protein
VPAPVPERAAYLMNPNRPSSEGTRFSKERDLKSEGMCFASERSRKRETGKPSDDGYLKFIK